MATSTLNDHPLLYPTFLEDYRTYHLVEAYWRRRLDQLLADSGITYHAFYNKRYANGQYIYDANPIFDAYFPARHKLVRIIQFYPESGDPLIEAYLDHWPVKEMDPGKRSRPADPSKSLAPIPELVIDLALTRATAEQALQLIQQWIVEDRPEEEMEGLVEEVV